MPDTPSLLPPDATALERALESAALRVTAIDVPVQTLVDPVAIPAHVLPFLAWHLSVDRWESDWSEATKRDAVVGAIAAQRRKGTPAAVEDVLASFDDLLELVEWHRATPRAAPHTFEVRLPLDGKGGARATGAFAEAIFREVARVKPARSHGTLLQMAATAGIAQVLGATVTAGFARLDAAAVHDTGDIWARLLQTELGEPIESEDAQMLEH